MTTAMDNTYVVVVDDQNECLVTEVREVVEEIKTVWEVGS